MKHAWRATFDFMYVKQTCNPDYRSDEKPTTWQALEIFLTDKRDIFDLRQCVKNYLKEYEQSTSLGSQRVDLQGIEYIGPVRD